MEAFGHILAFFFVAVVIVALLSLFFRNAGTVTQPRSAPPTFELGNAGNRKFDPRYFGIAIVIVVTSILLSFLSLWAVVFKRTGWIGFSEMLVFLAVVALGFYYGVRKQQLLWLWSMPELIRQDARKRVDHHSDGTQGK